MWLLLGLGLTAATAALDIEITPGAFWRPLPSTITYEASVPLFYKSRWHDLPTPPPPPVPSFCTRATKDIPQCAVLSELESLTASMDTDLAALTMSQSIRLAPFEEPPSPRTKRGLAFLGDFFHWCCDVITARQISDISTSEKTMEAQIQLLADGLNQTLAQFLRRSTFFETYENATNANFVRLFQHTRKLNGYLRALDAKFTQTHNVEQGISLAVAQQVYMQMTRTIHLARLFREEHILSTCRHHFIPSTLLPPNLLQQDLTQLTNDLRKSDLTLAISLTNVFRYYQLPICECKHTPDYIYLHLKIPVIHKTHTWSLFELVPTPFTWKHQVCSIQHPPTLLAVSPGRSQPDIRQLSGLPLQNCRPHDTQLCFLPRFSLGTFHRPSCAQLLFTGATIATLNAHCPIECHTSTRPSVTELTPDTFLIANLPAPAYIKCESSRVSIDSALLHQPGALKITVPCACTLVSDNLLLIPRRFPCLPQQEHNPEVVHILPAAWSTLKSLIIHPGPAQPHPVFTNFSECLNEDGPAQVPFINVTSQRDTLDTIISTVRSLRLPPVHLPGAQRDKWFLIWNIVLSGLTCFLWYKYNYLLGFIPLLQQARAHDSSLSFSVLESYLSWAIVAACLLFVLFLLFKRFLPTVRATYRRYLRSAPERVELQDMGSGCPLVIETIEPIENGRRFTFVLRDSPGAA